MKETLHAIATPRGTIRGMIHLPEADRFPLCCLFHGFQGNRIGSYAHLVDLSRALCGAGIGVARFDFIGSGESDGLFEEMTVSGELQDLLEIVSYAGIVCGGRETGLFLAGHSMGASVAGMAAGGQLPGAAGLILLAPAGEVSERITDSMAEFFDGPEGKAVYPLELNGQLIGEEFRRNAESLEMLESARRYPGPGAGRHRRPGRDNPGVGGGPLRRTLPRRATYYPGRLRTLLRHLSLQGRASP